MSSYAEYLVNPEQLAGLVSRPEVRIIDCRFTGSADASRAAYLTGHIPSAVHSYWLDELCDDDVTVMTLLPSTAKAERCLGALGISADSDVVAYADTSSLYATRLWQLLRQHGHARVRLLDGGLEAWTRAGLPLDTEPVIPKPAAFRSRPAVSTVITADELRQRLDDPSLQLVDTRTIEEFEGRTVRAARGGHIPGATLLPWTDLVDDTGCYLPVAQLEARFAAAGIDRSREVVTYCQGGIRAAHAAVAFELTGRRGVRIYDGSWAQWGNDPDLPVVASGLADASSGAGA